MYTRADSVGALYLSRSLTLSPRARALALPLSNGARGRVAGWLRVAACSLRRAPSSRRPPAGRLGAPAGKQNPPIQARPYPPRANPLRARRAKMNGRR